MMGLKLQTVDGCAGDDDCLFSEVSVVSAFFCKKAFAHLCIPAELVMTRAAKIR